MLPLIRKARPFTLSQLMEETIYPESALPQAKPFPIDFSTLGINNEFTFFIQKSC